MNIYFIITDKCNCKCNFCIRNNLGGILSGTIGLEEFNQALFVLKDLFPSSNLVLTGGEPFCHPSIISIIERSLTMFKNVIITTNGTFSGEYIETLVTMMHENLYLQISIDGPQNVHDSIRGNGTFNRAIENIIALEDVCSHLTISTTVMRDNFERCLLLPPLLSSLNFHHWKVSLVQEYEPCQQTNDIISSWNSFVDKLLPLCNFRVYIKKMFDFTLWDKCLSNHAENRIYSRNCGIGKDKVYITPKGNLVPCSCLPNILGNIFRSDANSILNNLSEFANISPSSDSKCDYCKYKIICNGGCPGYSYKAFGRIDMGDIRCPLLK